MEIGLFGGSFDPPHVGHQNVTAQLLQKKVVGEVWYVPVKHHHFGKKVLDDNHRVKMLELILQPSTRIETYELEKEGISYSFDTLEFLSQKYPDHHFSWIIGSDNLPTFHRWMDVHPMLLKYRFYVYPRAGFPFTPLYEGMVPLKDFPEVDVTSTEIRQLLKAGQSIIDLVDPQIEQYIMEHQLYQ
jgi:nicotinate-nucleotide adenylyltransferase